MRQERGHRVSPSVACFDVRSSLGVVALERASGGARRPNFRSSPAAASFSGTSFHPPVGRAGFDHACSVRRAARREGVRSSWAHVTVGRASRRARPSRTRTESTCRTSTYSKSSVRTQPPNTPRERRTARLDGTRTIVTPCGARVCTKAAAPVAIRYTQRLSGCHAHSFPRSSPLFFLLPPRRQGRVRQGECDHAQVRWAADGAEADGEVRGHQEGESHSHGVDRKVRLGHQERRTTTNGTTRARGDLAH